MCANIKLILLDADGVIQKLPDEWRSIAQSVCGNPARTNEFLQAFYATEAMFMNGREGVEDALEKLLSSWNPLCSLSEAKRLWWNIEVDREILAHVQSIRACRTSVALASNQQPERARYMYHDLGYDAAFDHCYYSCHLGYAKPASEFFQLILRQSDILESEVLFIDDQEANVEAARSLGLHVERFDIGQGVRAFIRLLEKYGVYGTQQGAALDRRSATLHGGK